ncbi:DUF1338 domain protein [Colletotrichum tofieldiae]|uniref:2-oxoadipate dioxygenase/decarboxylase n=1 Tax=Colletotrichum tofieldiae TaxID=708197 RepID=A0A166TTV0_9PEZI|nr:DUF1338 domain protein [Colletotrichum tofieldiae]GKT56665.1 DUF1338 domain protein [Colletotrichum tofieldiae]GKT76367.1 DUF1338 domain protein [Colletotrichum tofieldiae]GKT87410.1 DUF1338 domain protein [Colletotrichum tofieldiae]
MSTGFLSAHQPAPPRQQGPDNTYVDADTLRTTFALAMSTMYKSEVPLYGDLIQIVERVNRDTQVCRLNGVSSSATMEAYTDRITLERHGAIRLGTPKELHTVRRIFALLGMHPVGYYDLSVAGLPMHATCFRPISTGSLQRNPFRVFTTLLRPELITSGTARDVSLDLLEKRNIFSNMLMELLSTAENTPNGRLTSEQGERFVYEALHTFSWKPLAAATYEEYNLLRSEHPILADIACFRSSHINHLTPRVLDIDAAQKAMLAAGMAVKSRIEGPPPRKCPILLRQTSFLAIKEGIRYAVSGREILVDGFHKARFGEIEERGAAVTPAGRKLYDELLEETMKTSQTTGNGHNPVAVDQILEKVFKKYPDDWDELRRRGLVYSEYKCAYGARAKMKNISGLDATEPSVFLDRLVSEGVLKALPITYEDFLPFSAAGIFQSNLQSSIAGESIVNTNKLMKPDLKAYENALGREVLDSDELYSQAQKKSLDHCVEELELNLDTTRCFA